MAWDGDKKRWCPHATSGQRRSTGCPTLWRWYWSSRFAAGHLFIQFLWQHDGIGVNELPMNLYKCARNCDFDMFWLYILLWKFSAEFAMPKWCRNTWNCSPCKLNWEMQLSRVLWAIAGCTFSEFCQWFFSFCMFFHCSNREIRAALRIAALATRLSCIYSW